jgi:uncharacterized protein RhaS with RHS repeats
MTPHWIKFMLIGGLAITGASCAAQPRQRPLKTTPIAEGPNTMEAVRQALQGRWVLLSLSVGTEDGRAATVDATGVLTWDGFGNLTVEYRISEDGLRELASIGVTMPTPVVSTSGNVAIDPQQHRITYVGDDFLKKLLDADLAARRANPFALERTRYYDLGVDGTLTLSSRYDSGADAARSRWKKSS